MPPQGWLARAALDGGGVSLRGDGGWYGGEAGAALCGYGSRGEGPAGEEGGQGSLCLLQELGAYAGVGHHLAVLVLLCQTLAQLSHRVQGGGAGCGGGWGHPVGGGAVGGGHWVEPVYGAVLVVVVECLLEETGVDGLPRGPRGDGRHQGGGVWGHPGGGAMVLLVMTADEVDEGAVRRGPRPVVPRARPV